MAQQSYETFDQVKNRLDEIVEAVGSDDLPLDDALSLYEEAVGLGLRASELLEADIEERDAAEAEASLTAEGVEGAEGANAPAAEATPDAASAHNAASPAENEPEADTAAAPMPA